MTFTNSLAFSVLLQAMREDPPPDARCRDKFLVQTVTLSQDSDASDIPSIVCSSTALWGFLAYFSQWQNIEKGNRSSIQERKIRVVFLPADGSGVTPSLRNPQDAVSGEVANLILALLLTRGLAYWRRSSSSVWLSCSFLWVSWT